MRLSPTTSIVLICLVISEVSGQWKIDEGSKIGKPHFTLDAAGGGKDLRNFQAGYNAGVNMKVWESKKRDKSLELNGNYGRGFLRHEGRTYKSKPNYGIGATFKWKFGR